MARLQLDSLIFSLPAVETTHRRGSEQPRDADAFQQQLQKAGDQPAPADRNSATPAEIARTQSQHDGQSRRERRSNADAPSGEPPTQTRTASAKSTDEQTSHDVDGPDGPQHFDTPVEMHEKKPDQDVVAEQLTLPVAVAVPASPIVKDVATTETATEAAIEAAAEPTTAKSAPAAKPIPLVTGAAKTATANQAAERRVDDGAFAASANAAVGQQAQKATHAAVTLKTDVQHSIETGTVSPAKGKSDREHVEGSEQVNPELQVEIKPVAEKPEGTRQADERAPAKRTSYRQNDDISLASTSAPKAGSINSAPANSAAPPPPAAVANAPAQLESPPTGSAIPNSTPAAIAFANQPANLRSPGNNSPLAIGDQPVRTGVASGSRTTATDKSAALTQGERVRLVQRVSRAFHAIGENGGQLRLRLSPAELGSLKLEVTLREGTLTARMETETEAARNLLVEHLPQLRERLAEQGIKIESFEIDLMNQSSGETAGNAGDRASQGHAGTHAPRGNLRTAAPITGAMESTARPRAAGNSELDVLI